MLEELAQVTRPLNQPHREKIERQVLAARMIADPSLTRATYVIGRSGSNKERMSAVLWTVSTTSSTARQKFQTRLPGGSRPPGKYFASQKRSPSTRSGRKGIMRELLLSDSNFPIYLRGFCDAPPRPSRAGMLQAA
jgi:hypothetical protein